MTESTDATERGRAEAMTAYVESGFTMDGLSEVFVQSGFFKDVKAKSQAIVKILLGREIGLKPLQAMLAINMVQGKPEVAAATLGALVKRSGKYDYRVTEHTVDACSITFFSVTVQGGAPGTIIAKHLEEIGESRFEMADAKRAGLAEKDNYRHYPRNMLFARAMSNGVKWYCLDAIGGVPVWTEGELSEVLRGAEREAGDGEFPELEPKELGQVPAGSDQGSPLTRASGSADQPEPASASPVNGKASAMAVEDPVCVFDLNGVQYQTRGITKDLLLTTFDLYPKVNKKKGKGYAEKLALDEFGITTRKDLTQEQAEQLIVRLTECLEEA